MLLNYYLKSTYDFIYETLLLHHYNLISGSHFAEKPYSDLCVKNNSESIIILMIKRMFNVPMYIGFS